MTMTKRPKEDKYLLAITAFLLCFILLYRTCAKASTIEDMIRIEALKQGVDPKLAIAVAKVESNLNPKALGKKGEVGLFQLMPYHGRNLWNVKSNIRIGVRFLKRMETTCSVQDGITWVICYNQGTHRRPKHPQLHPYYKRVVAAMQ